MVNPGGARSFNPGESAQPADAGNTNASDLSNAARGNAESQLGEGRKALDQTQVAESTVGKFQLESGLFKSEGLKPQEFKRSADRASGVTSVENRMARFETSDGARTGTVHTGRDGTILTTRQGERYEVAKGPDGRTVLTNTETGAASEVLRERSLVKSINRPTSDTGPALVHRQNQAPQEITTAAQRARAQRQQQREARGGEGPGKFNQREFRETLKKFQSNPNDQQTQKDIKSALENHPEQATKMMQKMSQLSEAQKGKVDTVAKGSEATNVSDVQNNPDFLKSIQKALDQANQGKPQQLEAITKQMGLDITNPQTRQSISDLGQRIRNINPAEQGNVKLQDVLKGLDPQSAKSIESFLTQGKGNGAELTINQLDQGRFKALQTLLEGQSGKILDPTNLKSANINQIMKQLQSKPLSLEQPNAKAFGQNIQEIGQQLNLANIKGSEAGNAVRLSDITSRAIDGLGPNQLGSKAINELIAKLNPGQVQIVKTLIDNSRTLSNLIETGKINLVKGLEQGQGRMDAGQNILSDLVARLPGSMQGNSFLVKGEVLGSLAAIEAGQQFIRGDAAATQGANIVTRPDGSQVMMSPIEILSGKPIDAVTGLPYDPHTGKLLDPTTGRIIGQVKPGEANTTLSDKWESSKKLDDKLDLEQEEAERNKKKALLLANKARKLREMKERELREKELKEQKRKEEDKKRTKYIVKQGDTLESIAQKQLRDTRLALLIYNINKKVIPIVSESGKEAVLLKQGLVLWLPSPLESKEFRGQLMSGKIKSATTKNIASSTKTYATPEEELAAKFGEKWSGSDTASDGTSPLENEMLESALRESQKRKENIEKVLGTVKPKAEKPKDKVGRQLYVVRLGDSLKTVAMKHPLVRDVTLWKLIAEVNKLSTLTDKKGSPVAKITRGSSIKIPTREEIESYRERTGVAKALSPEVDKITSNIDESSSELLVCDKCGRMSVTTAIHCGCGKRISSTKSSDKPEKTKDSGTKATAKNDAPKTTASSVPKKVETKESKPPKTEVDVSIKKESNPSAPKDIWDEVTQLDEITRIGKMNKKENAPLRFVLEVEQKGSWIALLSYEIGSSRTLRHDDFSSKSRKTVKIDLPSKASEELAKNDLTGNWKNYKRKFLRS